MSEFADQVAVVTGAARGLGFSIATLLAERGATVYMLDYDGKAIGPAADKLVAAGHRAIPFHADAADEVALKRLSAQIEAECGHLEILINNAGGWRYGSFREISMEDWDWTFSVNVKSAWLATRALIAPMLAKRYGRVVTVASRDAYIPKAIAPHYAAAKAAVVSLTKSMAEELAPQGIMVNGVSPGAMATETAKAQGWLEKRIPLIPLGRAGEPSDIAEVVLFLASSRNRFVVGETVLVNGGMLMT